MKKEYYNQLTLTGGLIGEVEYKGDHCFITIRREWDLSVVMQDDCEFKELEYALDYLTGHLGEELLDVRCAYGA